MTNQTIAITGEYIELFKLLKLARIVETGGQGKELIRDGLVLLNDSIATELRKKVKVGDKVSFDDILIEVTATI